MKDRVCWQQGVGPEFVSYRFDYLPIVVRRHGHVCFWDVSMYSFQKL